MTKWIIFTTNCKNEKGFSADEEEEDKRPEVEEGDERPEEEEEVDKRLDE